MNVNIEKVIDHLMEKWGEQKPCPMCDHVGWSIDETMLELREFNQGNLVGGAPVFPAIAVSCKNCGSTHFLNAVQLDLIEGNTDD